MDTKDPNYSYGEVAPETIRVFDAISEVVNEAEGKGSYWLWFDNDIPVETNNLTREQIKKETIKSGSDLSEERINKIVDLKWQTHLTNLQRESQRLEPEEIDLLNDALVDLGVIPEEARLKKLLVRVSPFKNSGTTRSEIELLNGVFTFDKERYPNIQKMAPEELEDIFEYKVTLQKVALFGETTYQGLVNSSIDMDKFYERRMKNIGLSYDEDFHNEIIFIKDLITDLNRNLQDKTSNAAINEFDQNFLKTIYIILSNRLLNK